MEPASGGEPSDVDGRVGITTWEECYWRAGDGPISPRRLATIGKEV